MEMIEFGDDTKEVDQIYKCSPKLIELLNTITKKENVFKEIMLHKDNVGNNILMKALIGDANNYVNFQQILNSLSEYYDIFKEVLEQKNNARETVLNHTKTANLVAQNIPSNQTISTALAQYKQLLSEHSNNNLMIELLLGESDNYGVFVELWTNESDTNDLDNWKNMLQCRNIEGQNLLDISLTVPDKSIYKLIKKAMEDAGLSH